MWSGAVRAIGVSNFNAPLLRDLLAFSHSPVALLQNRADPLQSEDLQVLAPDIQGPDTASCANVTISTVHCIIHNSSLPIQDSEAHMLACRT